MKQTQAQSVIIEKPNVRNMLQEDFDTQVEAINALVKQGYSEDFVAKEDNIEGLQSGKLFSPHDLIIEKRYRFEGMTNPGDSSELLAITSKDKKTKGTLVMAYGAKHSQNISLIRQIMQKASY